MMVTLCIAGKSEIACRALDMTVAGNFDCHLVVLPSESNSQVYSWQPSLATYANEKSIPILGSLDELYDLSKLVFLSLEYNKIIDPHKFNSDQLYNLHFSYLPEYRGVYTSILPLRHGKTYSGVTIHKIDTGIDTGPILDQEKFVISPDLTARDLYYKYQDHAYKLLEKNLSNIIYGRNLKLRPQLGEASFFSRKDLNLGILEHTFDDSAENIHNFYRSLIFPEFQLPKVFGKSIISSRITEFRSVKSPGTLLHENSSQLLVSTRDFDICFTFAHIG